MKHYVRDDDTWLIPMSFIINGISHSITYFQKSSTYFHFYSSMHYTYRHLYISAYTYLIQRGDTNQISTALWYGKKYPGGTQQTIDDIPVVIRFEPVEATEKIARCQENEEHLIFGGHLVFSCRIPALTGGGMNPYKIVFACSHSIRLRSMSPAVATVSYGRCTGNANTA